MSWDLKARRLQSVISMQNVIAGRGDQAERGKCLRQVWINMLRQDTEILPVAMFLSPSSLFLIPYY